MKDITILRAVLRRISAQGDMHIRLRAETLERIVRRCGFPAWELIDDSGYREIDAFALEALCRIAGGKIWGA